MTFSLFIGWGLAVDVDNLEVIYSDLGIIEFVFGGAVGEIFFQNVPSLPPGTFVDNPITISFAAQVAPGSVTNDGTFLTGFTATGAGTIQGNLVPEPATSCLFFLAASLGLLRRSRVVF